MRLAGWGNRIFCGIGILSLLAGCAARTTVREPEKSADAGQLSARGQYREARQLLEAKKVRTTEENVLLGETCLGLSDLVGAERSFYAARVQGTLSRVLEYRVLVGLGDVGLARGNGYGASLRYAEAGERAANRAERDRALVGRARGELMGGEAENARRLRARVTMTGVSGLAALDGALRDLEITARAKKQASPLRKIDRAPRGPRIESRSVWRARSILRSRAEPMGRITRLTVHHTGENKRLDLGTKERVAARMRAYQGSHVGRGWADIGYHFTIDPAGRIWEGREIRWQGAHAGSNSRVNANEGNIGVTILGNYQKQSLNPRQKRALEKLVTWLVKRYRIHPSHLYTHDEIKKKYRMPGTICPGPKLAAHFRALRSRIRRNLTAIDGRPGDAPGELAGVVASTAELGNACACAKDDATLAVRTP